MNLRQTLPALSGCQSLLMVLRRIPNKQHTNIALLCDSAGAHKALSEGAETVVLSVRKTPMALQHWFSADIPTPYAHQLTVQQPLAKAVDANIPLIHGIPGWGCVGAVAFEACNVSSISGDGMPIRSTIACPAQHQAIVCVTALYQLPSPPAWKV